MLYGLDLLVVYVYLVDKSKLDQNAFKRKVFRRVIAKTTNGTKFLKFVSNSSYVLLIKIQ